MVGWRLNDLEWYSRSPVLNRKVLVLGPAVRRNSPRDKLFKAKPPVEAWPFDKLLKVEPPLEVRPFGSRSTIQDSRLELIRKHSYLFSFQHIKFLQRG